MVLLVTERRCGRGETLSDTVPCCAMIDALAAGVERSQAES